jgi:hypothetical protein
MQKNAAKSELNQDVRIRPIEPRDRFRIKKIIVPLRKFNQEEIATALELIDESLKKERKAATSLSCLMTGKSIL